MIPTGEAAKYAEEFEKMEAEEDRLFPGVVPIEEDLTEGEQITLFTINRMFVRDKRFRKFVTLATYSFGHKVLQSKTKELK